MSKPPGLFINDIPAIAQSVVWGLTPGPVPYETVIRFPFSFNERLLALENPVEMTWISDHGINELSEKQMVFKNLYLHDPRIVSEFYVDWKISDARFKFRGKKAFYAKNVTRIRNELETIDAPTNEKIGLLNASQLRQPFDTIKKGRYLENSIRNELGENNGGALKVSQVLQIIISNLDLNLDLSKLQDDGDYIIENMIAQGDDIHTALATLLKRNRLQMGIRKNGSLTAYSVDFFDDGNIQAISEIQDQVKVSPGRIYKQNLKNIRPKKIRVLFEKLRETRVVLKEPGQSNIAPNVPFVLDIPGRPTEAIRPEAPFTGPALIFNEDDIENRRVISCINVIRSPFIPANFRDVVRIGEYMKIEDFFAIIGITEEFVRDKWFSSKLELDLNKILGGQIPNQPEAVATMTAGAIRQHYRQVFMIDPFHMDSIKEVQARRATIIDTFSGRRRPSELWTNLCFFPRGRDVEKARGRVVNAKHAVNYIVNDVDPLRESPTPGTINIIDNDLGVFNVSFPPVTDTMIASVVPSAMQTLPEATPGGNFAGASLLLGNHSLKDSHTLETIVSTIWRYDKNGKEYSLESEEGKDSVYYDITYDFSGELGESLGPEIEFLCTKEYARYDEKGKLSNNEVIQAIADVEASKIMHQFKDRFKGTVELPGLVDLELTGNMNGIFYSMADGAPPKTTINMENTPYEPELAQVLPDTVRRTILKQIDPADV